MLEIDPRLKEDYDRWCRQIESDPFLGQKSIGVFEVLRAHYLILDYFLTSGGEGFGGVGPRNLDLLFSTMGRQMSSYGGVVKWTTDLDVCASLFFGLVKNHVFYDANKRTAFLTLLLHLWKNGFVPNVQHNEYEYLALNVAANTLDKYPEFERFRKYDDAEVRFISWFLKKKTRPRDPKEYIITYRELNRLLQRFGFWLDNPSRNRIEVWQRKTVQYWTLLGKRKREQEGRIGVISFPGLSRQMSLNDIRGVRRLTGLTDENGYDAQVFFHDTSPLDAFIEQYSGMLKRLSRK